MVSYRELEYGYESYDRSREIRHTRARPVRAKFTQLSRAVQITPQRQLGSLVAPAAFEPGHRTCGSRALAYGRATRRDLAMAASEFRTQNTRSEQPGSRHRARPGGAAARRSAPAPRRSRFRRSAGRASSRRP